MSEEPALEQHPPQQSTPATPNVSVLATSTECETNRTIRSIITLASLGIIGCFFLPWIRILLSNVSGFELQQLGDEMKLLWGIPAMAAVAVVASIAKQSVLVTAQFAGAIPFLALLYWGLKIGTEIFDALRAGAYLTLFLAAVLLIAPHFLKDSTVK